MFQHPRGSSPIGNTLPLQNIETNDCETLLPCSLLPSFVRKREIQASRNWVSLLVILFSPNTYGRRDGAANEIAKRSGEISRHVCYRFRAARQTRRVYWPFDHSRFHFFRTIGTPIAIEPFPSFSVALNFHLFFSTSIKENTLFSFL